MRAEGWEGRLARHVEAAYRVPFKWGEHDCALWSAQWVREATGQDFGSGWEGKYKTELGAARLLKRLGYATVADLADAHLARKPVPFAQRGDIVLSAQGCLGVCHGRHAFFLAASGVLMEPTAACVAAWTV